MKEGILERRWCHFIILLSFVVLCVGCSATKNVYKVVTFQKHETDSLKKRVLLLPFLDRAELRQEQLQEMSDAFVARLNKDNSLLLERDSEPVSSTLKMRSPEYGIIIDPDQAGRARELGMNVLLMGIINPLEFHTKKSGIWPFRGTKREAEVSMFVNALDVTNDTLLLTHLESRKFRLHEELTEWEEPDEQILRRGVDEEKLEKALADIIKEQAEVLSETLDRLPWSGWILSADDQEVLVNAGKDVGIVPGYVFDVYKRGEPIRSNTGKTYYLLGPKVGTIKTVEVLESSASAVSLSDALIEPGYIIRPSAN
ncbi:MAG: hypothetical protein ACOWYE_06645 [Desulfatiglandales bacterium]